MLIMEKGNNKFESNVTASFAYVKKDILMLNDSFSDLFERVAHLISNQSRLTEEITSLRKEVEKLSHRSVYPKNRSSGANKKAVKKKAKKTSKKK
jgi:regulator of replication initiation timing